MSTRPGRPGVAISRSITILSPGLAGPNWAATSPAADDTDGISAISENVGTDQPGHRRSCRAGCPLPAAVVQAGGRPLDYELVSGTPASWRCSSSAAQPSGRSKPGRSAHAAAGGIRHGDRLAQRDTVHGAAVLPRRATNRLRTTIGRFITISTVPVIEAPAQADAIVRTCWSSRRRRDSGCCSRCGQVPAASTWSAVAVFQLDQRPGEHLAQHCRVSGGETRPATHHIIEGSARPPLRQPALAPNLYRRAAKAGPNTGSASTKSGGGRARAPPLQADPGATVRRPLLGGIQLHGAGGRTCRAVREQHTYAILLMRDRAVEPV